MTLAASSSLAQDHGVQALLDADKAFDRDTAARGLDGWMGWFAEEAQIPGPAGVIRGKAALREVYSKMFAAKEFSIHWWPLHAELSADGTLGYTFGRALCPCRPAVLSGNRRADHHDILTAIFLGHEIGQRAAGHAKEGTI